MLKRILINISQVAVALAVVALVIFLAFKGSNLLLVLFSLAFIGAAVLLLFFVRRAVLRGGLPGRGSTTLRHASPVSFWFGIGVYVLTSGSCFLFGLAMVGLAPHWFIALLKSMHSHH